MENETDVARSYNRRHTASILRRIADALETGKDFRVQIGAHRVRVPSDMLVEFELEQSGDDGELEIEIKWKRP